ncbi:MAG: radical SAM protein [Proteobacteria bacterium]|nr:radical SAM protein [Pseudomonadota bacterium]MCP4918819.1 radical SAM protein [Pseudomonadota bacterium]
MRKNIELNVGKACNNKCVFCLDGLPKAEDRSFMPLGEMKDEITRWYESGHRSLGFLGGEPTTCPWLAQAMAHARDLGFTRIAIATNATRLRKEHYVDRLLDAGLTRVTVSAHGHTARLEDTLTRVPGNFEKKATALRILCKKRDEGRLVDNVSVNIVLNGWNYKVLPKMLKYFFGLGLDDVRANFIRSEGYADEDYSLTPAYDLVVPVLMKAVVLNEFHFKRSFTFGGFPLCVLPTEFLANRRLSRKYLGEFRDLDTDCSVRSSGGDHGIAKVEDGRARFNWQDRKRFDLKHHMEKCHRCAYAHVCEGVWKMYLTIHGDEAFSPLPG